MSRVCLVYPPFYNERVHNVPPLGILRLASYLEAQGVEVVVLDFIYQIHAGELPLDASILDTCAERILATRCDVVGFSTQCTTLPPSIGVAERLKRARPDLPLVFGGYGVSFLSAQYLTAFPAIDYIVLGEGELTFHELVTVLRQGGDPAAVRGIVARARPPAQEARALPMLHGEIFTTPPRSLIEDLDALPFPAYHLLPPPSAYVEANRKVKSYNQPFPIDSGRGCTFTCNFCSTCLMFHHKVRTRSPRSIRREIEFLRREHGVDHFLLTFDLFNVKPAAVVEFCDAMAAAKLDVVWECRVRLDMLGDDVLQKLHDAGCRNALIGIDSGSPATLEYTRKKLKPARLHEQIVRVCRAGIRPFFSFIIGFPRETPDDVRQTLELALFCQMHEPCQTAIHLATPLPGTDLYYDALGMLKLTYMTGDMSSGIQFDNEAYLEEDLERIRRYPELFSSFYNIDVPGLGIENLFFLHRLWNRLVRFFGRTLYVLCREGGLSGWDLVVGFREQCSESFRADVNVPVRAIDDARLILEFSAHLEGVLSTVSFEPARYLRDLFAYETAHWLAWAEQDPGGRPEQSASAPRLRPGVRLVRLAYDIRKDAVLAGRRARAPKNLVFVSRSGFGLDEFEVGSTVADLISAMDGQSGLDQVLSEVFGGPGEVTIGEIRPVLQSLADQRIVDLGPC